MMQPLRVVAEMGGSSSLAITRPEDLALDGILARAALEDALGDAYYDLPDARVAPVFVRLPLAMQGDPATVARMTGYATGQPLTIASDLDRAWWWWACATARLEGVVARDTHYWVKRFDTRPQDSDRVDFGGRVEKVVIEAGRYKAYHQPLAVIACRAVSWACVGDAEALNRVLWGVGYLAKKRSQGNGAVKRWRIEPLVVDESLLTANGALARPIPLEALNTLDGGYDVATTTGRAYIAYRAPQWLPYNQALCAVGE